MIASDLVAKAPADGYTLLWGTASALTINPALYNKTSFDPAKAFAPVALLGSVLHVLVASDALGVRTTQALLQKAKQQPGQLTYASVGNGTSTHLEMELLKKMAEVDIVHVPYKGSTAAMVDLLGGRVDVMFDPLGTLSPHLKTGRLVPLGVTSARRSTLLPDVPSLAEAGLPGYEVIPWVGLLAPAGTSPVIVERLNSAANQALASTDLKSTFTAQGVETLGGSAAAFSSFMRKDLEGWKKGVKDTGVKPE
ncbi:hypothetical protein ASC92_05490 [Variovorax sp. Root411]|nr:hypothetical protein ASC92_05490 [Variovorax sp. Root411]